MIVVMQLGAPQGDIDAVVEVIRAHGAEPLVLPGEDRLAIGIPSALGSDQRVSLENQIGRMKGVSKVTQTSSPYKLASKEFYPSPTIVKVKDVEIGAGHFSVMAGPCSVESYDQFKQSAEFVKASGAKILRGGAFKPRSSPYSFQGLQVEGLKIIQQVSRETGLVTITEVMSADMVGVVADHVDILQIGARSMQNFPLLIEAAGSNKPIFLKRGPSALVDELLLAAEYILSRGNPNVILCERGIVPLDRTYTRNTLDLAVVPVLKEKSHLPVIVDPSHGTGVARYVRPMSLAAMAAGADGIMVEMHPDPSTALSDGSQTLDPTEYAQLMTELKGMAPYFKVTM